MKKITFIRHAESNWNAGDHSEPDCRITDCGKTQAARLDFYFDLLILSPSKRTLETYVCSDIKSNNLSTSNLFTEYWDKIESEIDFMKRLAEAKIYLKNCKSDNIGVISHAHFIMRFLDFLDIQNIQKIERIMLANAEFCQITLDC